MPTQEAQSARSRKEDNLIRKQLRLEQCAWANRRVMTPSELRLWSALSARKLGVQFRRQLPLAGCYIVDFCAPSARLVIEVDGALHALRVQADSRRDAELRAQGAHLIHSSQLWPSEESLQFRECAIKARC
jgi:very-short-patch-repair endonuclease